MTEQPAPKSFTEAFDAIGQSHPELVDDLGRPNLAYELARAVMTVRKSQQLTQAQLAKKAGMSQQQVADIEGMKANLTIRTLDRLCHALGIELRIGVPEAS